MSTIFIVDDNLVFLSLFEKLLKLKGFQIIGTARDGESAVNMFKSFPEKPDIVLIDHHMPIKNGLDTVKEIVKVDIDSNIIFTSEDRSIKYKAKSLGASSFIVKPYSFEELNKKIKKLILNNELIINEKTFETNQKSLT